MSKEPDYSDIIHLQWEPKRHPRMPLEQRAAQFAPFAALTGHDTAIENTARKHVEDMEGEADNFSAEI